MSKVSPHLIPTSEEVVAHYEHLGGNVTHFPIFGKDPLLTRPQLQRERKRLFNYDNIKWEEIYGKLVNNDDTDY